MPDAAFPVTQPPLVNADPLLAEAQAKFCAGDFAGALGELRKILAAGNRPPGTHYLMSLCYFRQNLPFESLQAVKAEMVLDPSNTFAAEHHRSLMDRLVVPGSDLPAARPWTVSLDANSIRHLEHCSHRYTYRSVPMDKNVFDLALYPMLLWQIKPRTIIEVGSFYGASAMWMADMLQGWGLDSHVYSVDINRVWTAKHDRVSFITGNGQDLGSVFSDEFLAGLPRPLLVIEDADHSYTTTAAVLKFFHERLHNDEYIIVEDVMTCPTETGRALREFLAAHPTDYLVDRKYCDFFGTNLTWCINGYLKRIRADQV
jgi:cephalosporin hydroxylase